MAVKDRDQYVQDIVYGSGYPGLKASPCFSGFVAHNDEIDALLQTLNGLGFSFTVDYLPRSTMAAVSYKPRSIVLPVMPHHKAICLMVMVLEDEIMAARKAVVCS